MPEKTVKLMQGNEACVEGAIAAGMMFYAGYPITPSTEIAELSAAKAGVGWMVWRAYDMFDIEKMFVALITLAILGYVFSYILYFL